MKTILVDAVNALVIENQGKYEIFEEMFKLLESYPNKKILLTGASGEKIKYYGLDKMPYEVFTLSHNPPKSDTKYFEMMLKHFNFNSADTIYFEHNQEAVDSARFVGIKTYFYDNDKKDLAGLKEFFDRYL